MSTSPPTGSDNALPFSHGHWIRESRLGRKLMGTRMWYRDVLSRAFLDFSSIIEEYLPQNPAVLDAGCGEGLAFKLIERHFKAKIIFGLEIDKEQVSKAIRRAVRVKTPTHVMQGDASLASFRDDTFDIIFAHHILHHTEDPQIMVQKFMGLLKPGGLLLSVEYCRSFTLSWLAKLLFNKPPLPQKTAQEYLQFMRNIGLIVDENHFRTSRPWFTRRTFGLAQTIGITRSSEPSEILIVARKPLPIEIGISTAPE